jgi:hypothetical protein
MSTPAVGTGSAKAPNLASRLGARLARLSLANLPVAVRILLALTWVAVAVLSVLAAIPGLVEALFADYLGVPVWFRVVLLAACAVVAAGSIVADVLLGDGSAARTIRRDAVHAASAVALGLLLLASDAPVPGVIALVAGVATVTALHVPLGRSAKAAVAGAFAAMPWLAAGAAQFAAPDPGLYGWIWIVFLLPLGAGLAAFGALYGVARAAESRVRGIQRVFRNDVPRGLLVLAVGGALAVVALRYTVLSGLFGEYDVALWAFRLSPTWIHAALVAAAIVVVALISLRRPLSRVGRGAATAVFGAAAALQLVAYGPLVVTLAVTALLTGSAVDASDPILAASPWISLGIVAALALVVAHPVFAGSAGRWMAWLGAFYAIPGALAVAAGPAFDALPSFWAKPPQVAALLAVGAAGLVVHGLIRPRSAVPRRLILKLALIPLVAVHATALLPAPWESTLGRAVLIVGVVLAVLFFAPRRTADPVHRAQRLLTRTTGQLAGLVVFLLAVPSDFRGETFGALGTIWLAIPVAAVLCLTLAPRTAPTLFETPSFLLDEAAPDERAPRTGGS